jgi:hypothetical protein
MDVARFVQLFSRMVMGLCLLLLGKLGMDVEHTQHLAAIITTAVVGGAGFAVDLLIHSNWFIAKKKAIGALIETGAAVNTDQAAAQLKAASPSSATPPPTLPFLLLPFLCIMLFASCSATPLRQSLVFTETAAGVVQSVTDANKVGLISNQQLIALAPLVEAVITAQQSVELSAQAGKSADFVNALDVLNAALLRLLAAKDQAIKAKTLGGVSDGRRTGNYGCDYTARGDWIAAGRGFRGEGRSYAGGDGAGEGPHGSICFGLSRAA